MSKQAPSPPSFLLSLTQLDRNARLSLPKQLYNALRDAILSRQLEPGLRLPSSRDLADLLQVSRGTVVSAFEQLLAEGYLEARVGAGTFVSRRLPEVKEALPSKPQADTHKREPSSQTVWLQTVLGDAFQGGIRIHKDNAFIPTQPDLNVFPFDIWARLASKLYKRKDLQKRFGYDSARGYLPLREAIASHVKTARGIQCEPEQVLVTAGAQQAILIATKALLNPGDSVWLEDPGYNEVKLILHTEGAKLSPVSVDEEGLDIAQGKKKSPDAKLVYITPSHQFPLGYTMSLARRLELLEWAEAAGAWILEDDYDSEFRYDEAPIPALQSLDLNERVIYIGSFSKVLFPGLRLGYMIVPKDLISAFTVRRVFIDHHSPVMQQAVLAEFMTSGQFVRHIRRMRMLYKKKRDAFISSMQKHLGLDLGPSNAGMHVVVWLPEGMDDNEVSRHAASHNVVAMPLSRHYLELPKQSGLVLGYTGVSLDAISEAVKRLARALSEV